MKRVLTVILSTKSLAITGSTLIVSIPLVSQRLWRPSHFHIANNIWFKLKFYTWRLNLIYKRIVSTLHTKPVVYLNSIYTNLISHCLIIKGEALIYFPDDWIKILSSQPLLFTTTTIVYKDTNLIIQRVFSSLEALYKDKNGLFIVDLYYV